MTTERSQAGSDPERGQSAYTVEVRENGNRLSLDPIPDPFISTRVRLRGWRSAWAVLRRGVEVEVIVGGDRTRINAVMELDPDYIGPAGSKSREAWNRQLKGALGSV